ncbi:MAG: hypothetical protein GX352_06825 [Clostridiales bacterium]|nr:hypothetical protein [Clostridiales bacterium]
MTTIAISRSLAQLKEELEGLGYRVYYEDEINTPTDIFIYSGDSVGGSLYSANQMLSTVSMQNSSAMPLNNGGTLLIDAKNKSLAEIKFIIENRTYSPLF